MGIFRPKSILTFRSVCPASPLFPNFQIVTSPFLSKNQFYGFLGLTYLLIGIAWSILVACYWREILHIQIYISGIIFLCMVEMTFSYAYYANYNETGLPC